MGKNIGTFVAFGMGPETKDNGVERTTTSLNVGERARGQLKDTDIFSSRTDLKYCPPDLCGILLMPSPPFQARAGAPCNHTTLQSDGACWRLLATLHTEYINICHREQEFYWICLISFFQVCRLSPVTDCWTGINVNDRVSLLLVLILSSAVQNSSSMRPSSRGLSMETRGFLTSVHLKSLLRIFG